MAAPFLVAARRVAKRSEFTKICLATELLYGVRPAQTIDLGVR